MSGRSGGGRHQMYGGGGGAGGSQHDLRVYRGGRRKEQEKSSGQESFSSRREDEQGGGDGKGSGGSKPEEVRISKLTRLMARLDTEESFMTICNQIEGALNEVENQKYVYRCFQCLCPSFLEVFKGLSGLTWEAAGTKRYAKLLSKICKSMENQRVKFFQWMVDIIMRTARGSSTHVSSSAYVMEAVSIHLISGMEPDDIIKFVRCTYDVLEDVGNPRVFRVLGAIFVCGTNATTGTWRNPHFQDFIDLVVGWMVDPRQCHGQFTNCAELLEKSKYQFEKDLTFLMTLMSQLLEDLEQAIKKVQPSSRSDSDEFKKVLQLMKAFASLLGLECQLDKLVLTEFCDRLVVSTLQFIRMCEPHQSMERKYLYELLLTVNKSLFFSGGILSQSVTKYFRAQLKLGATNSGYARWPKLFLMSFLESITVWVEVTVSQTQLADDIVEICGILLNMIDDMVKTMPSHDHHYILSLVTALLRTRNISLLQKVYTWLISKLPNNNEERNEKEIFSETLDDDEDVLFVLAGLADIISNKSSSILSLWALQPAVFELLVDIINMKIHPRTQQCAMELLKTHCSMHSHFVSSVASAGSFSAESPGAKILPALMDFWLEKLKSLPDRQQLWLIEWIFEFLEGTSSYASLLYNMKPEFFHQFLITLTQRGLSMSCGIKILDWFCKDPDYSELEVLSEMIREKVLAMLLEENLPERMKSMLRLVLFEMKCVLVVPDVVFIEDCKEANNIDYEEIEDSHFSSQALTATEFNMFLHELLVGNSSKIPKIVYCPPGKTSSLEAEETSSTSTKNNLLSVAADHLIRLKLKTPLGKPQDFFMQLLLLLKRSRAAKIPVPVWKLHFVFELEKKFQLWTYGTAMDDTELTEHVRQFYLMNKSPFLEWLKRIRLEVMECCLILNEYALAYFNAALMGVEQKMEQVLFKIGDRIGLQGMGNAAGYLYLDGKYEESLKLLNEEHELGSSENVLSGCLSEMRKWPEFEELKESNPSIITSETSHIQNLLDLQLGNKHKLDFSMLGEEGDLNLLESLRLPFLQKIHCWILSRQLQELSIPLNPLKLETFERIRMDKMISSGNMNYVQNWLKKKEIDISSIVTDEDLSNLPLTSIPVATLKVCADFYAKTRDNKKSVILYNILRELVTGSSIGMDSSLANKVTINLCNRIYESEEFFNIFSSESLSHCDRLETIKSLHQVAIHSFPEHARTWLAYGDFTYDQIGQKPTENVPEPLQVEFMKYTTVECYSKYIQLSARESQSSSKKNLLGSYFRPYTPNTVVMTRLLQLFRQGFYFEFEETIKSEEWLELTAEIAQIPEMRSYFVQKFPGQVSLFFSSHDNKKVKNKFTVRRRNLFDLAPFTYVDCSDETLSSNVILSNLNQLEKISEKGPEDPSNGSSSPTHFRYEFRSNLEIPEAASVFAQELLRLAGSMEDMWVWSLERIALDWGRRLTYLRKECGRSLSSDKIQAFIQPTLTYLKSLLLNTEKSTAPIDINFLNRHKNDIQKCLDLLLTSRTLEEVSTAMNTLMKISERFSTLSNNKLPVTLFSPKLASPDFYEDPKFSLNLPGQSSHLKISNIHPILHSLPTKTKPKRIRILADNGKYYDYLVKGSENLNIDCGVMQFLQVIQSFFKLPTRSYSVTPLGKRGGLIQIVPDAVPLFTLYKKHLQRNKCLEKTSEMFWRRMDGLGYDDRSSLAALREVYEMLKGETSGDLITRELLLSATNPAQWLNSMQTFTKDCAIGSAIGYLIGIGDRHLDNILVNVRKGKFVHVDFSIIFGKGASLRVPEKVPFRLTQNVQSVLQHPGPSGAFHIIMEDVLKSFQDNKETASHLIKNIAFCHLYDEDAPVDLTEVLMSEVDAAVKLFQYRAVQYLSTLQLLRLEMIQLTEDIDLNYKITRRMNRLRRMLVNLNTVLQFVTGILVPNSPYSKLVNLVHSKWTHLFQTILETGMEQRILSANSFVQTLDETENLLKELQEVMEECTEWNLDVMKLQDSNIQVIDLVKVDVLVNYAEMNIQSYNSSTVTKLVDEATSVDNLAQMYEGWTAWV